MRTVISNIVYDVRDVTFPSSPLCFDRIPPPFFTATSSVLLCNSTTDTLNSNLHKHMCMQHTNTLFKNTNTSIFIQCKMRRLKETGRGKTNWRLIIDRIHCFLYGVCFSASRASFIRQQIQTDVWIRTIFSRRDQIPANTKIWRLSY